MLDTHLLCHLLPGLLIGRDFFLSGKVLMPCLEVIAAMRLCLSMRNASTMAREESNSVIG